MPNILVGTISGDAPATALVGVAPAVIVPENVSRVGLMVTNISDQTVYCAVGQAATLKAGIVLTPGGGAWSMDEYSYSKQAVSAVGHSDGLEVALQEFSNFA